MVLTTVLISIVFCYFNNKSLKCVSRACKTLNAICTFPVVWPVFPQLSVWTIWTTETDKHPSTSFIGYPSVAGCRPQWEAFCLVLLQLRFECATILLLGYIPTSCTFLRCWLEMSSGRHKSKAEAKTFVLFSNYDAVNQALNRDPSQFSHLGELFGSNVVPLCCLLKMATTGGLTQRNLMNNIVLGKARRSQHY